MDNTVRFVEKFYILLDVRFFLWNLYNFKIHDHELLYIVNCTFHNTDEEILVLFVFLMKISNHLQFPAVQRPEGKP